MTMENGAQAKPVPTSRFHRMARLGTLASSVAGGMLAEGARQIIHGKRPHLGALLLTPANAQRVTKELSRMRGAAMKVGQLLSMDAGDLMPPMLTDILSALRSDAVHMPMSQLLPVLSGAWGEGCESQFDRFSFTPVAAASIGQVHKATTKDGYELAIKVQYPGVRESIDSDVDNVSTLLRLSGLLPTTFKLEPLLSEAKAQLHAEADYLLEAAWLETYANLLHASAAYKVPVCYQALTTRNVLAMSWVEGQSIESLSNASSEVRDRVACQLFELVFQEIFEFGVIQSDPNFANYRFDPVSQQLFLLDFGATRTLPMAMADGYRHLMRSAQVGSRSGMQCAAESIGYWNADIKLHQQEQVLDIFELACEPLCFRGPYDFGNSDLPVRMHQAGLKLAMDRDFWHTPPIDAIFLHRKLAGIYLLAARIKARVDISAISRAYL